MEQPGCLTSGVRSAPDRPRATVRGSSCEAPEESWADDARGRVRFRTLVDGEATPTDSITAGVSELPPGGWLGRHRHEPAEVYHVLSGEGTVEIDDVEHPVGVGATVFIPGGHWHAARNTGTEPFRVFYVFAVDTFAEVEYEFAAPQPEGAGGG